MTEALDPWQERLERHFSELSASREETGLPVFALEHGLCDDELAEIAELLRRALRSGQRLRTHWLAWVIHATEQGYGYEDLEYWISFEENMPHWRQRGSPQLLKSFFSNFQRTYNGVTPSGRWAEWFSIISWPITHAILPRYLQWQFARILFESSHDLARLYDADALTVGQVLANNAWDTTPRFRVFLEQQRLAGRIVLALFNQGTPQFQSPIFAPTLARIVSDLEKVRDAGEWLREARRTIADRLHGLDTSRPWSTGDTRLERPRTRPDLPSLRPSLLLRRTSARNWSVVMEVPSFNAVARLNPALGAFLKHARCKLAGTPDTWLPGGWTLFGAQKRVMKNWPADGVSMIQFERSDSTLDNILRGECRFPAGPVWLFHIGADGLAREIIGRSLRPEQRYVLISRTALRTSLAFVSPATIDCVGASAVEISVPDFVSPEDTAELQGMGLQVARNIRLWPAGLCVRNWDGDGHGDWLSTETPCFGIVHDHAVDEYYIRLDSGTETLIKGGAANRPIFIQLDPLAPGKHVVAVRARRVGIPTTPQNLRDLEGRIELKVRDPSPWTPGTTSHSGLSITIEPPDPSLDSFWEGSVGVSVLGPEGRCVICAMSLTGRDGSGVLSEVIGNFDLPVTTSNWFHRFKRFAGDEKRAWKYLEAATGQFTIKGEELGEFTLRLDRERKPIRWVCRTDHHETHVRLIDDTGREAQPQAELFSFQRPTTPQPLDVSDTTQDIIVQNPGGLFLARQGDHRDGIVITSSRAAGNFRDLIVEPKAAEIDALTTDHQKLLYLATLWQQARLAGPLANNQRDCIVQHLLTRLYRGLCGERWGRAEISFIRNPKSPNALQELERAVCEVPGFRVILRREFTKMNDGLDTGVKWFCDKAKRYGVNSDFELCTFALRFASFPFGIAEAYGGKFDDLMSMIKSDPTVLRGARLVVLLCVSNDTRKSMLSLPGWPW